jgi:hypothetical protein
MFSVQKYLNFNRLLLPNYKTNINGDDMQEFQYIKVYRAVSDEISFKTYKKCSYVVVLETCVT